VSETLVRERAQTIDVQTTVVRVRFVSAIPGSDVALMAFNDPAPCHAIVGEAAGRDAGDGDFLDVMLLPSTAAPQVPAANDASAIYLKYRGVELTWRPGHATLQCDPGQADSLLPALAEFAHYEGELRRIETEIATGWAELDQDKALAFEVKPTDLARSEVVGGRMNRAFGRRISYARIEPHLYEPDAALSAAGQKLGAELREKARIEARLETVDAQLEVYEHVYEMSSQRLGEYRASHEEHKLEWIIIVLLAAELLALLAQMVWNFRR
jgi:hypothetical protein